MRMAITSVFLDHNVWHVLFRRRLGIDAELPRVEFAIGITREAEFEIAAIPPDEAGLRDFIAKTRADRDVVADTYFGFNNEALPQDQQRVGGFGVGRWASADELEFIAKLRGAVKPSLRKTKLYKNEADLALAARSFQCVVASFDERSRPLRAARDLGGKVVFLTDWPESGLMLGAFIKHRLR